MGNLTTLDLVMIGLYLAVTLFIGIGFKGKIKNTLDYYVAGRSLGTFVLLATVCASIVGGSAMIGRGGIMYSQGVVGILLGLPYLVGMYVFTFMSGRIQAIGVKTGIASIPDLMAYRFGNRSRYLIALLIAFSMMATVASQIAAFATILKLFGDIDFHLAAWIALGVIIAYTTVSGLYGVVYTDVVQFVVLIIAVYIILPFRAVSAAGGVGNIFRSVPPELLEFHIQPELMGWIITNLIFTFAGAEMWQRAFAAKSVSAARKGMLYGNTIYAATIVITVLLALSAVVIHPGLAEEFGSADAVIPAMAQKLLPSGLVGLALAGMVAVIMSSADTYLLISVQTVVRDIIAQLIPDMSERRDLALSRLFSVLLGVCALVISLYIDGVYRVLMFAWTFYAASVGIPALLALYWRDATGPGLNAGVAAGFIASIAWRAAGRPWELSEALVGAILCTVFAVGVSLLTARSHPSRMAE